MSRYFDETVRARNAAATEAVKLTGVQEFLEATAASTVAATDPGTSRLGQCRKTQITIASSPHTVFKGLDSLEPAEESYRALRTRLLRLRGTQGIRSVVITSAIQGEGKTLTSMNLGMCCAQLHDMRVLLIDADLRGHGLSKIMGLPATPGLADVLSGRCQAKDAILASDIPNLYVLGSGSPEVPPSELFAGRGWQEFIGWCNESFKLILIDTPPVMNLADVELIHAPCDGILMVVRANYTKREVLQQSSKQIDSKKLLGLVYNAVENHGNKNYTYAYQSYASSSNA